MFYPHEIYKQNTIVERGQIYFPLFALEKDPIFYPQSAIS
jgi:hypothetical protein